MKKTDKARKIKEIHEIEKEIFKIEHTINNYIDAIDLYNDPNIEKHRKISATQLEYMEDQLDALVESYVKGELKKEKLLAEIRK